VTARPSPAGISPAEADPTLRARLRALPKAELHVHLDGSLRPATLLELAGEVGAPLPAADPVALADAMRADDATDLPAYLSRFETTLAVMQTAPALERITRELVEDHAAEGVRYVEIRYSPVLHTREGLTLEEAVEAPLRGLRAAEAATGIRGALIVCGLRTLDPAVSVELAKLAVAFRDRGVVAFDLAGAEAGYPAEKHAPAFQVARDANLAVTIHAGEAWGADSIHQALHRCGANRIGHGTRLREDPALERWVRDFRVPLEICLTCNVQTRVAPSLAAHPVRRYLDQGIVLTLCTDNRLMSGVSLVDEYARAAVHLSFTWEELTRVARMGFEGAFLPWDEKRRLLTAFDAEVVAPG
jgi:adenosine deaminase